jgi:hypothetical protein
MEYKFKHLTEREHHELFFVDSLVVLFIVLNIWIIKIITVCISNFCAAS